MALCGDGSDLGWMILVGREENVEEVGDIESTCEGPMPWHSRQRGAVH